MNAPTLHVGQLVAEIQESHAAGHTIQVGWKKNMPVKETDSNFRKAPTPQVPIVKHSEFCKYYPFLHNKQFVFKGPLQTRHSLWQG